MSQAEDTASAGLPEPLRLVVEAVEDHKGADLLVLDVREVASFTDYILLCSGQSDRHVQSIADGIVEKLAAHDTKPLHTEGYRQARWVLADYVDFLVNVFTPEARGFYQLERVWRDAPVLVGERDELAASNGANEEEAPAPDEPSTSAADG